MKLKGLGRGLDALLTSANITLDSPAITLINLTQIIPGKYQPRIVFTESYLQELAESIKQNGVVQPIIVKKIDNNSFEIIAGERRWRSAKIAGLTEIPAIIRDFSEKDAFTISLIENLQRKDLNIIEEAKAYKKLIDEFNLTHDELAKLSSKSRSHITNIIRLLNLDNKVQDMLLHEQISMGHARALISLDRAQQIKLAEDIIANNLTTKVIEQKVVAIDANKSNDNLVNSDIKALEEKLNKLLKMKVSIADKKSSGKIIISYSSLTQLNELIARLEK